MQQIVHRTTIRKLLAAFALIIAGSTPGSAAAISAGCASANRSAFDARLSPGDSISPSIELARGDILDFSIETQGSASLTLESGQEAGRSLYSGPSKRIAFTAPDTSSYAFRVAADGSAAVVLRVTCTSYAVAESDSALAARRSALLSGEETDRIKIDKQSAPKPAATPPADSSQAPGELDADGRPKKVVASVSLSEIAAAAKLGQTADPNILDFWFEGRYQTYESTDAALGPSDGDLGVMFLGSKYMLGPDIMVGALAQFDRINETSGRMGTSASGGGWMVGPYVSMRFGSGVVFDGRAAWGTSEIGGNDGSTFQTDVRSVDMLRGTLRGTRQIGGWTLAPSVGVTYLQDIPASNAAAGSVAPASGQGVVEVLPELKRRFDLDSSTYIEPRAAFGGSMSFDEATKLNMTPEAFSSNMRLKAETGVAVGVTDGMKLEATGGVETNGQATPDAWSGRLRLNMPLDK